MNQEPHSKPKRIRAEHHKVSHLDLAAFLWKLFMQDKKEFSLLCHRKLWPPKHLPIARRDEPNDKGEYIVHYNVEELLKWLKEQGVIELDIEIVKTQQAEIEKMLKELGVDKNEEISDNLPRKRGRPKKVVKDVAA